MEDRDILELYFARDEAAIKETDQKYGKLCHSIAINILDNREDAEECVNDAYLGLWNSIPPKRPNSLCAFAAKLVRNHSMDRLKYNRAKKRNSDSMLSFDELEAVLPDTPYFQDMDEGKLGRWISEFLYTEDEDARNVFIRKYWFFDSIEDIAAQFGYSRSKVKSMLFRTRQRLWDYLTKKGVAL